MMFNVLKDKYKLILVVRNQEHALLLEEAYGGTTGHRVQEFDFNLIYEDFYEGFKKFPGSPHYEEFIQNLPDVAAVINCAGVIIPHVRIHPAQTFFLNSALPHILAATFQEKLIHITTDCVFNGIQGYPYDEHSSHTPVDLYGITKSLGEPTGCLTLRTSVIGPEVKGFFSLLGWFKQQSGKKVHGFRQHFWNGLTTKEFAKLCFKIIENRSAYPENGIFHIFSTTLSKYEMLLKFREKYDVDCDIIPDDSTRIDRTLTTIYPLNEQLQIASFDVMLNEL